jgi:hypothetical protein
VPRLGDIFTAAAIRPMVFRATAFGILGLALATAVPATASTTMVRLGYARCSACHIAPQGGGLLTDYGKGIDIAQSLKASEYQPPDPNDTRPLRYDLRLLTSIYQLDAPTGTRPSPPPWLRTYLRGSAAMGSHNRLAGTVAIESPQGDPARLWETRPVVELLGGYEFRANDAFTLSVTRDRLPRGVELGETRTILQEGEIERYPAQVRAYLSSSRFHVTAFAFAPGSEAARDRSAHGRGVLGEVLLFSNHVVLGASAKHLIDTMLERQAVGGYARMGFGRWGILAEHEFTSRTLKVDNVSNPHRYAGFTQVFFAPVEWLVTSITGEQADDRAAVNRRVFRWRPEVQARLTDFITITASARTDTALGVEGPGRMYLVQVAVKTVQ